MFVDVLWRFGERRRCRSALASECPSGRSRVGAQQPAPRPRSHRQLDQRCSPQRVVPAKSTSCPRPRANRPRRARANEYQDCLETRRQSTRRRGATESPQYSISRCKCSDATLIPVPDSRSNARRGTAVIGLIGGHRNNCLHLGSMLVGLDNQTPANMPKPLPHAWDSDAQN